MNEIVRFPPKLRLIPMDHCALSHPRLQAFDAARREMLARWRELVGSDEVTSDYLLEDARSTGAGLRAIAVIMRDLPTEPDQTPPDAA